MPFIRKKYGKKKESPMNFNIFPKSKPLEQPKLLDTDGDGVPDLTDCAPWNKNKHGKIKEYLKEKFAQAKKKRAYAQAASQQRQKVAQAEYYRAKETEAKKLAKYKAEQERKKEEERYKFKPKPKVKPLPQRQESSVWQGGINVPPPRDIFGQPLYPQKPEPKKTLTPKKKKTKKRKKKVIIGYV